MQEGIPGIQRAVFREELGGLLEHIIRKICSDDAFEPPALHKAPREQPAATTHVKQHLYPRMTPVTPMTSCDTLSFAVVLEITMYRLRGQWGLP